MTTDVALLRAGLVEDGPLARLATARALLAEARTVDEVKAIRDKAEAARVYAREARLGLEAQNFAAEVKLRAERRAGEVLADVERQRGERTDRTSAQPGPRSATTYQETLRAAEIAPTTAKRWQAVARLPEPLFEQHIAAVKDAGHGERCRIAAQDAPQGQRTPMNENRPVLPPKRARRAQDASDARDATARAMSEAALQAKVVKLARLLGWRVLHHHDSRRTEPGFPDLLMARCDRGRTEVLYAELKREGGKLTDDQRWWCERLGARVWRPSDWLSGRIAATLQDGRDDT